MSTKQQNQAKETLQSSFTPAPKSLLQRQCACGQHTIAGEECAECRQKREGILQRATVGSAHTNTAPPIVRDVLSSPGQPLDADARAFMEPRFNHDFSHVRVHTDARAAESARSVNALAYTVGQNVVFGQGQYSTATSSGRRLLAHELTHTVQQSQAGLSSLAGSMRVSEPSDANEREAEAVAERLTSTSANETVVANIHPVTSTIQRLGDLTKVPPGLELECEIASDSPPTPAENLLFGNDVFTLSSLQQAQIDNFVMNWRAAGGNAPVRVDGYASTIGTDEYNWRLSCNRSEEVVNELTTPSSGILGIPAGFIRTVAQGETTEFGAEANNRRATISSPITLPPTPPPAPTCANPGDSRILELQPIFLRTDPADTSPTGTSWARRFNEANAIWGKVGITFVELTPITLDTPLKTTGATNAEANAIGALRSGPGVEVFLVDNDMTNAGGASTAPGCGAAGNIVMSDRGTSDTLLAHELAHTLFDSLNHPPAAGDPGTIAEASNSNSAANPTRNTMVNFNRIVCPAPTGSTCLNPDP